MPIKSKYSVKQAADRIGQRWFSQSTGDIIPSSKTFLIASSRRALFQGRSEEISGWNDILQNDFCSLTDVAAQSARRSVAMTCSVFEFQAH
jgi:hypothetical protein